MLDFRSKRNSYIVELKFKCLLLLIVVGACLFLSGLGGRDLWEPDETRYAVVAREMRQGGNWTIPFLNGVVYTEKPPFFFWMVNLSSLLFGKTSEFANRFPSALAGLMTVLITFHLGSKLFNPVAGFLSGLILATCLFFPQISRWMMLDSLFCLLFLLAVYHFYLGMSRPENQRFRFLLAGIFMALATLTKGPIGFLPIPLFLVYSATARDLRNFWNRNLFYTVLLSIGLVMVWLLPAVGMAGKSYGIQNILHQTVGRFVAGWSHPQPFYFYLVRFPVGFLPWVIFLPWAVIHGFSQKEGKGREFLFVFIWFAFIFCFFSLSKGKKENYLLPLYPAAAILVGGWLSSCWGPGEERRKLLIPMVLVAVLFMTVSFIILFRPFPLPQEIEANLSIFGVWSLFFLGAGGVLSLVLLRRSSRFAFSCIMAGLIIAQVQLIVGLPGMNDGRSLKPFARRILCRMAADDHLKIWKFQSTGLLYYTEKYVEQIKSADRLSEVFRAPHRVFMVAEKEDLAQLIRRVAVPFYTVERAKVGSRELFLISNRPVQ